MRFMCSVPGFVLRISPWPARWAREINGEVSGSYFSAAQAADDAGCRLTGRLLLCGEAGQPAGQGWPFFAKPAQAERIRNIHGLSVSFGRGRVSDASCR